MENRPKTLGYAIFAGNDPTNQWQKAFSYLHTQVLTAHSHCLNKQDQEHRICTHKKIKINLTMNICGSLSLVFDKLGVWCVDTLSYC